MSLIAGLQIPTIGTILIAVVVSVLFAGLILCDEDGFDPPVTRAYQSVIEKFFRLFIWFFVPLMGVLITFTGAWRL